MSRLVEAKPRAQAGPAGVAAGTAPDDTLRDYGERVAKYVPAEVLAFYTAAVQFILMKDGPEHATFRLWAFATFGILSWIAVPVWLGRFSADPRVKRTNQIVATIAFGAWAYAYPAGWFAEKNLHDPVIAGLLLLTFTLVSGFVQPRGRSPVTELR